MRHELALIGNTKRPRRGARRSSDEESARNMNKTEFGNGKSREATGE
jgi:hypothetical protein